MLQAENCVALVCCSPAARMARSASLNRVRSGIREPADEALHKGILRRLARRDVMPIQRTRTETRLRELLQELRQIDQNLWTLKLVTEERLRDLPAFL